jgi:hypothetical protein
MADKEIIKTNQIVNRKSKVTKRQRSVKIKG